MKTVLVIQARMGSSRLPGKVLMDLNGAPMLERVLQRVRRCATVDEIWVATSNQPADVAIIDFCERQGVAAFAGSESDVLSRYARVASRSDADQVVRVTADCPLIDPELIDAVVKQRVDEQADYASNFFPKRWYPRGLDVEVLTRSTLDAIDREAEQPRCREHVTLSIYENPGNFRIASVQNGCDQSKFRWTVDTPQDLQLIRKIYRHFGDASFDWQDVLSRYEENRAWYWINRNVQQKAA